MRTTLLTLMVALPAAGALNAAWCGAALAGLVREVPRIASTSDLERFKRVVARQMVAALVQIGLLGLPALLLLVGFAARALTPGDVVYLLVPSAVMLVIGLAFKPLEARVKTLPTADDELRRQRDAVVRTWLSKPLPDW